VERPTLAAECVLAKMSSYYTKCTHVDCTILYDREEM
jgi:hypothetical protein